MPHTKKQHVLHSNLGRRGQRDIILSVYLLTLRSYMGIVQIDMFLYVRIDVWEKMTKKAKTVPATGRRREHGLGRYLQGREGEQGEARSAISAPRGRPHLALGRLRLKPWPKSDFSIFETTWVTYLYIYIYY